MRLEQLLVPEQFVPQPHELAQSSTAQVFWFVQSMTHAPAPQETASQAPNPVHSMSHVPVAAWAHDAEPHASWFVQSMSHTSAVHRTPLQLVWPEQATWQLCPPQVTGPPQLSCCLHSMSHEAAWLQSIPP
jgi:hypothetical protein